MKTGKNGLPLIWVVERRWHVSEDVASYCYVDKLIERAIRRADGYFYPVIRYGHRLHPLHGTEEFVFLQSFSSRNAKSSNELILLHNGNFEEAKKLTPYPFIYTDEHL